MTPERYSHVTHLVSEVVGELRDGVTPFELLRACFPAGTVSGAPKVRAMQIISELEGYRRGVYAGAVGYVFPQEGELDTCIAIRTLVLRDGIAYLQAGGGIVADSDPADEHEECLNKLARARDARSSSRRRSSDDAPDRQLRLVHVQPRAPVRRARRRGDASCGTTSSPRDEAERARAGAARRSPPVPAGRRTPARRSRSSAARADDADARRLPRPPGDRRGVRRRGRLRARAAAREGEPRAPRRHAASSPGCRSRSTRAATTRSPRRAFPTSSSRPRTPTTAR